MYGRYLILGTSQVSFHWPEKESALNMIHLASDLTIQITYFVGVKLKSRFFLE